MNISKNMKIVISIAVVLFVLFVWPTPYRYDKLKSGTTEHMYRTNRITGTTTYLY
jgi:hypothetical protein